MVVYFQSSELPDYFKSHKIIADFWFSKWAFLGKRESGVRSNLNKFNADFWQNWDFSIFFQILEVGVVDICEDWTYWESCPADFKWRIETDLQEAESIQGERYLNGLILKKWRTVNCWRREKWHQLPEETIVLVVCLKKGTQNMENGRRGGFHEIPWVSSHHLKSYHHPSTTNKISSIFNH